MTPTEEPIHILIAGAGAIGLFYGSRLHQPQANVHVSLVCRSNYRAIKERGCVSLRTRTYGDYTFTPHAVFPSIDAARKHRKRWHFIVVTTKALPDVNKDDDLIAPLLEDTQGEGSTIVLIQNGVGLEQPYRDRFPKAEIISAVTNMWTRISCGPFGGSQGVQRTKQFVQLCQAGGVRDAEEYDEVGLQLVRWHKIAINVSLFSSNSIHRLMRVQASMNPSACLSNGAGNSRMSLDPELRIHLKACMDEVFHAAPIVLGRPFPSKLATPDKILTSSERNTSGKPSMLLDWQAGRPMELEVILGNPIRLAKAKGIEMPRLHGMYSLLKMAQTMRDEANKSASSSKAKM